MKLQTARQHSQADPAEWRWGYPSYSYNKTLKASQKQSQRVFAAPMC